MVFSEWGLNQFVCWRVLLNNHGVALSLEPMAGGNILFLCNGPGRRSRILNHENNIGSGEKSRRLDVAPHFRL